MRGSGRPVRAGQVTLRYLTSTTNSSGVTYYYLRRKGRKVPLGKGPTDSPEFLARYAAAMQEAPPAATRAAQGSVASVVEAFRAGTVYAGYSAGYRAILTQHMDAIRAAYGTAPMDKIQPQHIRADLARLKPHPASARLKAWRLICGLAHDRQWSPINATDGVKRPKPPQSDGHTPWSAAAIERYRERHQVGTVQRLCMELLFWTAARTVDAVTLSPSMIGRDGIMTFTQSKTGGKAYVPWDCPLPGWAQGFERDRAFLKACLRPGTFTFLETGPGKARSRKGLSNVISAAAEPGLSAHGLRKSRLTAIAESGGSASAIMSWGGHKSLSEAEAYVSTANRKSLLIGTEQDRNSANTKNQSANTARK